MISKLKGYLTGGNPDIFWPWISVGLGCIILTIVIIIVNIVVIYLKLKGIL